jgi:hypothetical protein
MCLGGPNHCRVGRAGGQSYLAVSFTLSCDHHLCMWLRIVRPGHLLMFILVASYSSSGGDAESNGLLLFPCTHAHTHTFKKKKKKKKKILHLLLEWLS